MKSKLSLFGIFTAVTLSVFGIQMSAQADLANTNVDGGQLSPNKLLSRAETA